MAAAPLWVRLALLVGLALCFSALAIAPSRALPLSLALIVLVAVCLWAWPSWWVPLTAVGLIGITGALAMVWSQRRAAPAADSVRPGRASGREIFYGKGYCSSCHTLEDGGGRRGPPLGASTKQPPIGRRAAARADQLSRARGRPISPAGYLVESLVEPGAFVVPGYRDEMPPAHLPPLRLQPGEIRALVLFLLEQGGQPDPATIELPATLALGGVSAPRPPLGDSARGRELYFDLSGPAACVTCHPLDRAAYASPQRTALGPDLSRIGGVRNAGFLRRSILEPSAQIAGGFETVQIELLDGTVIVGLNRGEDPDSAGLVRYQDLSAAAASGAAAPLTRIPKSQIRRRSLQLLSTMPGNYAELLTGEEVRDLVAFLSSLR